MYLFNIIESSTLVIISQLKAFSLIGIHEQTALVADPLNSSLTIVTLKGITPPMETIKPHERKHQPLQVSLSFSLSASLIPQQSV